MSPDKKHFIYGSPPVSIDRQTGRPIDRITTRKNEETARRDNESIPRQTNSGKLVKPGTISDIMLLIGAEAIGIPSLALSIVSWKEGMPAFVPIAAFSIGMLSEVMAGFTLRNMDKNHQRLLSPRDRRAK